MKFEKLLWIFVFWISPFHVTQVSPSVSRRVTVWLWSPRRSFAVHTVAEGADRPTNRWPEAGHYDECRGRVASRKFPNCVQLTEGFRFRRDVTPSEIGWSLLQPDLRSRPEADYLNINIHRKLTIRRSVNSTLAWWRGWCVHQWTQHLRDGAAGVFTSEFHLRCPCKQFKILGPWRSRSSTGYANLFGRSEHFPFHTSTGSILQTPTDKLSQNSVWRPPPVGTL
jgi:hypothetical protein